MSVSEDRTVQPSAPALPLSGIADPAPLGLAAFALTTFLLSARNAGWMTSTTGNAFLTFALAYGGLAQLLAAMWEFRNRNVIGATGFGTFGAFWIGIALWVLLVVNPTVAAAAKAPLTLPATVTDINHELGWILLGFAIFTVYATILISQTNTALFITFFLLLVTLVVLAIGQLNAGAMLPLAPTTTIKIGGYLGVITAAVAWYTSAAGMAAGIGGRIRLPVGPALVK
ncbi:MAG TPA: acetate uptake transporter [Streptosporangiaceae bacterium]|nr:acetate uptake transporter [Streptosporangiaceae bacterium]